MSERIKEFWNRATEALASLLSPVVGNDQLCPIRVESDPSRPQRQRRLPVDRDF